MDFLELLAQVHRDRGRQPGMMVAGVCAYTWIDDDGATRAGFLMSDSELTTRLGLSRFLELQLSLELEDALMETFESDGSDGETA